MDTCISMVMYVELGSQSPVELIFYLIMDISHVPSWFENC